MKRGGGIPRLNLGKPIFVDICRVDICVDICRVDICVDICRVDICRYLLALCKERGYPWVKSGQYCESVIHMLPGVLDASNMCFMCTLL